MKQVFIAVFVCFGFSSLATFADENQPTPEQLEYLEQAKSLWNSLDRRNGEIKLPNGVATLNVPESFYYLSPEDAEKVLHKRIAWSICGIHFRRAGSVSKIASRE